MFEIKTWPVSEILAWKTFFNLYGPLDWEREDIRDARRVWLRFGKRGTRIEDLRIFRRPKQTADPVDKEIANWRAAEAIAEAAGNKDGVDFCRRQIREMKLKKILHAK